MSFFILGISELFYQKEEHIHEKKYEDFRI